MTKQIDPDDSDLESERLRLNQKYGDDWEMCSVMLNLQRKYEKEADKGVILLALWQCLLENWPIPPWLLEAFDAAYLRHLRSEIKSWDEIFGDCTEKGAQPLARRRKFEKAESVFFRIKELSKAGKSVNKDLFIAVGEEFSISGSLAETYFADVRQHRIAVLRRLKSL